MSADPRGPNRTIVRVDGRTYGTFLTLSCGHVGKFNQTFMYTVGAECRCYRCGPHGEGVPNANPEGDET